MLFHLHWLIALIECIETFVLYFFKAISDCASLTCQESDDWHVFEQHCYFVSTTATRWRLARDYCQQAGAELVSMQKQEELDFVISTVSNHF